MKFVSKPNITQANRDLQRRLPNKKSINKKLTIYSTTITVLKLTAHNDIKHVEPLSTTISSCENSCWHVIINQFYGNYYFSHIAGDVNTLTSGSNKRPPSIKQSWCENSSGLLKYAGPSAPTRNNNIKRESYLLITSKINSKSGPARPTYFPYRKNGGILHSLNKGNIQAKRNTALRIFWVVCVYLI